MRKLFTLLLAICAITTVRALGISIDGINYILYGDSAMVIYTGASAYEDNTYTGDIVIPASVTYADTTYRVSCIGDSAFSGCTGITSVSIPNSVTSIGEYAFENCSGLTQVTIPEGVDSIGAYAFRNCTGLTQVVWNAKNCTDFITSGYSPFWRLRNQITSFTFGNDVKHIPAYLCYGMAKLTAIAFPDSLTSIGGAAFNGCSGLTSVTLPEGLTTIDNNAFYKCSGITSLTLPSSIESIGQYAFYNCYRIKSVTIPANVSYIGLYAFQNCGFNSVVWNAENCIDYDRGSRTPFVGIGDQIASFTFGDGVKHIPAYLCYGMTNIKSVSFPNSVSSIGGHAFEGCDSLTSITFGNDLQTVGDSAFSGCTLVTEMTCYASVIPQAADSSLASISSQALLYVPAGCKASYELDPVWGRFDIREMGEVTPTALSELDFSAADSDRKIYRDGILYIRRDGHLYDFTGRKVE